MRRRFFVDRFEGGRTVMSGEAAHHLGRVLRAEVGQVYELSDGERVRLGRVESVGWDRVEFALLEEVPAYRSAVETTLLLSIVKFDAFEWALEKATELGVGRVVPLAAARSEKALIAAAGKRSERWRKILLEALTTPTEAFGARKEELRVLLSERGGAPGLKKVLDEASHKADAVSLRIGARTAVLAIGPEGGWTDAEVDAARKAGFSEASLGRLILRTETAVIAALAAVNYALSN